MTERDPRWAPGSMASPAFRETHAALLVLLGDRAYKMKKPVSLGFLDFSTREAREEACRREVALNRRFAPDVYLGVATIEGPDGTPCEHMIVMRRMPDERRLSTMLADGRAGADEVRTVVRTIAGFHARAPSSPEIAAAATPKAIEDMWRQNLDEMLRFEQVLPEGSLDGVRVAVERFVRGRLPLFEQRIEQGWIRDGHGDLLSADIFLLDDGPRILDCIEFNDQFRFGDVLADIAFLAMDLEARGFEDLAAGVLAWHAELLGDRRPQSLADHYVAYRALVRSKVACVRAEQGEPEARERARALMQMTLDHLERARVRVVLVGGSPGTGKTTLASTLSDTLGWPMLRTDVIRKEITGTDDGALSSFGTGIYDRATTARTYDELLARAGRLLGLGESVILDATWAADDHRQAARRLAHEHLADVIEMRCAASGDAVRGRLRARAGDASDADVAIAERIAASFDAWPDATVIDTGGPPGAALVDALPIVRSGPPRHRPRSAYTPGEV